MRRWLAGAAVLAASISGCQFISGVNDLEVENTNSGGAGGTAGASGSGGAGGSGGTGAAGGSSSGGSNSSTGGSAGASSENTSGGTGGSTNTCTDRPNWDCDLLSNCGCDANDQNCGYDASVDAAICFSIGSQQPYAFCIQNQECPLGHGCIGGVCKKYCETADDCSWESAECLEVFDEDKAVDGVGFCTAECNLLDPATPADGSVACGDDSTCYPVANADGDLENTLCIGTESDGAQDDPCLDADGERDFLLCGPSYFCSSLSNSCQKWCRVANPDCEVGADCIAFDPPVVVNDEELGTCFTCASGDSECSLFPTCGCDAGEACQVVDFVTGSTRCGVPGSSPAWGSCQTQQDCAENAGGCVAGFCRPFCEGPGTLSCAIGECFQAYSDTAPIPGVFYCDAPCEPVLSDIDSSPDKLACGPGFTCLPAVVEPTDAATGAYCDVSAEALEGESCVGQLDCANGYGCIDSVCVPWCRNDDDCSAAFPVCDLALDSDRFVAPGDEVGLCLDE